MSIETDWQVQEYAHDIHYYLRTKEQKRLLFRGQSAQLLMRKSLVDWLIYVSESLEFCKNVQHLAVYLLDIFMDHHTILESHLKLVSLGCLYLACKLEEKDCLIPPISHLNALVGNKYRPVEFYRMEITIFKFFKFDILFPTTAHFLEYYLLHSVNPSDCKNDGYLSTYDTLKLYFQKYADYFLEITIKDIIFLKFNPSLVAASCIVASRLCLGLTPSWPAQLLSITFYKQSDLKQCVSILLRAINTEVLKKKFTQICSIACATKNSSSGSSCTSSGSSSCTLGS